MAVLRQEALGKDWKARRSPSLSCVFVPMLCNFVLEKVHVTSLQCHLTPMIAVRYVRKSARRGCYISPLASRKNGTGYDFVFVSVLMMSVPVTLKREERSRDTTGVDKGGKEILKIPYNIFECESLQCGVHVVLNSHLHFWKKSSHVLVITVKSNRTPLTRSPVIRRSLQPTTRRTRCQVI